MQHLRIVAKGPQAFRSTLGLCSTSSFSNSSPPVLRGGGGGLLKNLAKSLTFCDCSLKASNSFRYCQRPVSFCGPSLIEFSVNIYKEVFGI